ncbi:class I SAM-dependent methyltransferase [Deltaproteobacteria bacterium TL4]
MTSSREFLSQHLTRESAEVFGVTDPRFIENVTKDWLNDESNSSGRFQILENYVSELKKQKILDMACGCGTFVFYGLLNGYDVWGLDPEQWKREFNALKIKDKGYPQAWISRFVIGYGEALPFENASFDVISSYQTLEHVSDVEKCLDEMDRILKPKGVIHIQAPDYSRSYFEPHYRLPVLPKLSHVNSKQFLTWLKRPTVGWDSLNRISQKGLTELLKTKGYEVMDLNQRKVQQVFKTHLRLAIPDFVAEFLYTVKAFLTLLTKERMINILAIKPLNPESL